MDNKEKSIIERFNSFLDEKFGTKVEKVVEDKEPTQLDKLIQFCQDKENKDLQPEKFETVLLVDGETEITVEPAVEVGAAVVLTAADGTPVAAPVGEYELQDGRVIVVAEEGLVAEVREMSPEAEEPMANDQPQEQDKVKRIIERIESEKIFEKISELEETVKFLKEENEALTAKFAESNEFTKDTFNKMVELTGKEPVAEPVKKEINPIKNFRAEFESSSDPLAAWLEKTSK